MYTISFKRNEYGNTCDPLVDSIRSAARAEGWARMDGFKQWAKERYGATLRANVYNDWTSITFRNSDSYEKFLRNFGLVQCD